VSDFSSIARIYRRTAVAQKAAAERLFWMLRIERTDDVLDLGCGTGHLAQEIRVITDGRVVGIDLNPEMIALAREAALKLLELTDGGVIASHDSPLGFRHGPKTIVNARTLVVLFLSNHAFTRRYDLDLLDELRRDGQAGSLLAICGRDDDIPPGVECILIPSLQDTEDIDLLLPFIAAPQIFAFEAAIERGLSPDNPNVAGTVNRIVQGVRIHPFR